MNVKKLKLIFLLAFVFLLLGSISCFATTGDPERDAIIKNNFLLVKKYVNENYGEFQDYVIVDCGQWIDCFILNPNGGYCRAAAGDSLHSNYSLIFNLETTLHDDTWQISPTMDNWNSEPNFNNYSAASKTVFTTVPIEGVSCTDVLDLSSPTETPQEARGTLAPIVGKLEIATPITTTLVGLVKLLIPLLICLVGFWKAWQFLSTLLRKA